MATLEFEAVDAAPLTRDEIRAAIGSAAREWLGISCDEFLARLSAGELDQFEPRVSQLALLARLLTD